MILGSKHVGAILNVLMLKKNYVCTLVGVLIKCRSLLYTQINFNLQICIYWYSYFIYSNKARIMDHVMEPPRFY